MKKIKLKTLENFFYETHAEMTGVAWGTMIGLSNDRIKTFNNLSIKIRDEYIDRLRKYFKRMEGKEK